MKVRQTKTLIFNFICGFKSERNNIREGFFFLKKNYLIENVLDLNYYNCQNYEY